MKTLQRRLAVLGEAQEKRDRAQQAVENERAAGPFWRAVVLQAIAPWPSVHGPVSERIGQLPEGAPHHELDDAIKASGGPGTVDGSQPVGTPEREAFEAVMRSLHLLCKHSDPDGKIAMSKAAKLLDLEGFDS